MSELNGFNVSVPEAHEETNEGYVILKHGQEFRIRLHNHHKDYGRCLSADATVYVQGKCVGTFRVPYGQTMMLEHPVNDTGKFTAYKNGTSDARMAEIDADDPENGLIKVIWKPGSYNVPIVKDIFYTPTIMYPTRYDEPTWDTTFEWTNYNTNNTARRSVSTTSTIGCHANYCVNNSDDLCGGGVGLSGNSEQAFSETAPLIYNGCNTTICLRIAFKNSSSPRPLEEIRVYTTKVPRPLR